MFPSPDGGVMDQPGSQPVRNQIMRRHVSPSVVGVNNNSVGNNVYREMVDSGEIKQEPVGSPPSNNNNNTKPVVNKRKKRGASEDIDKLCDVSSVKVKSETSETDQVLHFTPFQPTKWRETYNSDFQNLKTPVLKVTADKGFNFSQVDDAFIAQKKNHFQLSCHVAKEGEHSLVTTDLGVQKIEYFQLNFYGVKKEASEQRIQVDKLYELDNVCDNLYDLDNVHDNLYDLDNISDNLYDLDNVSDNLYDLDNVPDLF